MLNNGFNYHDHGLSWLDQGVAIIAMINPLVRTQVLFWNVIKNVIEMCLIPTLVHVTFSLILFLISVTN